MADANGGEEKDNVVSEDKDDVTVGEPHTIEFAEAQDESTFEANTTDGDKSWSDAIDNDGDAVKTSPQAEVENDGQPAQAEPENLVDSSEGVLASEMDMQADEALVDELNSLAKEVEGMGSEGNLTVVMEEIEEEELEQEQSDEHIEGGELNGELIGENGQPLAKNEKTKDEGKSSKTSQNHDELDNGSGLSDPTKRDSSMFIPSPRVSWNDATRMPMRLDNMSQNVLKPSDIVDNKESSPHEPTAAGEISEFSDVLPRSEATYSEKTDPPGASGVSPASAKAASTTRTRKARKCSNCYRQPSVMCYAGPDRDRTREEKFYLARHHHNRKDPFRINPCVAIPMVARKSPRKTWLGPPKQVEGWKVKEDEERAMRSVRNAHKQGYETLIGNIVHMHIPGANDLNRSWMNYLSEDEMEWGFPYKKGSLERPRCRMREPYLVHQLKEKLWKFPRTKLLTSTED